MNSRANAAAGVAALCVAFSLPARAQTSDPAAESTDPSVARSGMNLEQIVVSAQRRAENVKDVPIAVSALTSDQLAAAGISDVTQLRVSIPALNVLSTASYSTPHLRGVGSAALGPGIENPIATYVDGVYLASASSALLSFNNISQIEVLKGPQGTLFGRNATGGLIQVITRDPQHELGGKASLSYGNFDYSRVDGYLTGGITENLAADVAVQASRQGQGWGTNLANGRDVYDSDRDISVRSKWLYRRAGTDVTLIGDYSTRKNSMIPYTPFPGTSAVYTPSVTYNYAGWDTSNDKQPLHQGWGGGLSLRVDHDFSMVRLASISAVRESRYDYDFDLDMTPVTAETIDARQRDRQFTQELQLLSNDKSPFTWVVGAFFYDGSGRYDPSDVGLDFIGLLSTTTSKQGVRSTSGYGQATFPVLPETNLTLGARYTREERELDGVARLFTSTGDIEIAPPTVVDESRTFSKVTFRAAIDHHFNDDSLGYISFNRGFKSGGYNAGFITDPPFDPETLDASEIGLKSSLLEHRLRVNASAFHYRYTNLQVNQIRLGAVGIVNGASARLYGLDLDIEARLIDGLRLSGGVALLRSEFRSFPDAPISSPGGGIPLTSGSATGNDVPIAPKRSFTSAADYAIPLSSGSINFNLSYYYNSGWFPEADNVIRQKAFSLVNATAGWAASDERLSVYLWGKNLGDKRVQSYSSTVPEGTHTVHWAAPRTYGLTLETRF